MLKMTRYCNPLAKEGHSRYDRRVDTPDNRRAHPRVELVATVEVGASQEDDLIILTATNLSMGGVFLEANPSEHPTLKRGSVIELAISLADTSNVDEDFGGASTPPPPQVVRALGKIVRLQLPAPTAPSGYGVVITELAPQEVPRLHALLARASPKPRK